MGSNPTKDERRQAAAELLTAPWLQAKTSLDIFLVPPGWQDMSVLDEVQQRIPHQDPDFWWNAWGEARRFSRFTEGFAVD